MAKVMNKGFQTVVTEESDFDLADGEIDKNRLKEVVVQWKDVMKLLENLEVNKAPSPDGVSNWILKECRTQLADKIYNLLSLSLL